MAVAAQAETEHAIAAPECRKHDRGLLLIGIFKLTKAIFFVSVAAGAMHFIHHDLGKALDRVVAFTHLDAENRFVSLVLGKADQVTHHRIRQFSIFSTSYAILCSVEGIGLMRRKIWAEYFTLWLSASFVPWELYEVIHHFTWLRVMVLATNLLIVLYLVWLLRRKRRSGNDL